jgi:drug/metabolite transporter (DMT)-like permease
MVFLGACGFSAKAVLVKIAYREFPIDSVSLLALRMLFSVPFYLVIAAVLAKRSEPVRLRRREWAAVAGVGITGYYLASFLDFWGLRYVTASVERLILFIYPTLVVVISALFFRKRITYLQVAALVLTYLGMAVAFADDLAAGGSPSLAAGAILIFFSALTYALYLIGSGELIPRVGSLRFTCYAMLASSVATFLHCAVVNGFDLFHFPARVYGLGFWMAIGSTVIPTFLVSEGIRRIGSGNAAIIGSVGPMITIVLAYVWLGETVGLLQLLGTLLVLAGVLLITWRGSKVAKTGGAA